MSESKQLDLAFGETHYNMFPELRYFVKGEAPIEDLSIYFRFQKGWPTTATVLIAILSAYPLLYLFNDLFGISRWYSVALIIVVQIVVNGVLLSLVIPKVKQRQIRKALRERLFELGIVTCRNCAYDLRGSPECCPECGTVA